MPLIIDLSYPAMIYSCPPPPSGCTLLDIIDVSSHALCVNNRTVQRWSLLFLIRNIFKKEESFLIFQIESNFPPYMQLKNDFSQ